MISTVSKEYTCSVCGTSSEHEVVIATSQIHPIDLDTRQGNPKRNIVHYGIHACPDCGYCAIPISTPREGAEEVIKSEAYRQKLVNPDFPQLANRYLCQALIREKAGNLESAGWSCVHAAWVCDDAEKDEASPQIRLKAVKFSLQADREPPEQICVDNMLFADLLRRAGAFGEARIQCEEGLKKATEEIIRQRLEFEMELIEWGDTGGYNLDYVIDPSPEPPDTSRVDHSTWRRRDGFRQETQEKRKAWQEMKSQKTTEENGDGVDSEDYLLKGEFE